MIRFQIRIDFHRCTYTSAFYKNKTKDYCYSKRENVKMHGLMEMKEISIVASKKRFKEIAEFILKSIEEVEDEDGHEHLRDNVEGFKDTEADLIIMVENEK